MMAAIAALCNFLITYGHNFLTWFYNTCVDGINGAISVFVDFCITVIALFPTVDGPAGAPAAASGHLFDVLLTAMNWLCPMAYIVSVVGSSLPVCWRTG